MNRSAKIEKHENILNKVSNFTNFMLQKSSNSLKTTPTSENIIK